MRLTVLIKDKLTRLSILPESDFEYKLVDDLHEDLNNQQVEVKTQPVKSGGYSDPTERFIEINITPKPPLPPTYKTVMNCVADDTATTTYGDLKIGSLFIDGGIDQWADGLPVQVKISQKICMLLSNGARGKYRKARPVTCLTLLKP